MNGPAFHPQTALPPHTRARTDGFTEVALIWIEKRTEQWIRFGRIARERIIDRRRRIVCVAPDSVFAVIRWAANDHGTVLSRIAILRTVQPGEPYQTVPSVRPGGDVLLSLGGWPKVERVLETIDAIDALGIDPCDVPPDYWRHVHNRLTARQDPRAYTHARHWAWLKRRRAGQ